jgi:hypothetical protein
VAQIRRNNGRALANLARRAEANGTDDQQRGVV